MLQTWPLHRFLKAITMVLSVFGNYGESSNKV